MKTKILLIICLTMFSICAFAQTEVALDKSKSVASTDLVASNITKEPVALQPTYCNYQVTSLSGTCHNMAVGDILCKACDPSGSCPPRISCTKGSCTVNVSLVTTICTGCLNKGHHANSWTCN